MKSLFAWLRHNFGKIDTSRPASKSVIKRSIKQKKVFDRFYDKTNLNAPVSGYYITGVCSGYFPQAYCITGRYDVPSEKK